MAASEYVFLVLCALLAGTNAWLGEYACENIVRFGSRADVEQCFQDRLPEQVSVLFLKCAQDSHASRAYTVLQDYCQDDRFQDQVNTCMNQDPDVTLVTQNVAFRTLRTCLHWIPRSVPDESSESGEESGRSLRKRDVIDNEINTDEKVPKTLDNNVGKGHEDNSVAYSEGNSSLELIENIVNAGTDASKTEGDIAAEAETSTPESVENAAETEAPTSLVTEITNLIEELPDGSDKDVGNDKDIGEEIGLDEKPDEFSGDVSNDIPPEEVGGAQQSDEEKENDNKEEVDLVGDKDEKDVGDEDEKDVGDEDEKEVGEEDEKDVGDEDEKEAGDEEGEENNDGDEEEETEGIDSDEDERGSTSEEKDNDDDNNSVGADSEDETEDDSDEFNFSFPEYDFGFSEFGFSFPEFDFDFPEFDFGFLEFGSNFPFHDYENKIFESDENQDEERHRYAVNKKVNRINFMIYLNKK